MGLNIIKGRNFSKQAMLGEINEMMVTQSLAHQLEPSGKVLGKVYQGQMQQEYIVVGITEDFNHPRHYQTDKGAHIWWASVPFAYTYTIETHEGHTLSKEELLAFFKGIDSRFNLWQFFSIEEEHNRIIYMDRITLYMSYLLGGFTLLLASVGIYGVLSYNMGLRRSEFGIRMALGAKKKTLYLHLLSSAIYPISIGFSIAVVASIIIYHTYNTSLTAWLSYDIYIALPALLITLGVAFFACFRPMQLIIKQQPMRALRNE